MVITGAGRGLGRVLAHAFSHAGAWVALVARTETDLKAVPRSCRARPWSSAATSPRRISTRRSPTPPWPNGAASTSGSATPAISPVVAGPLKTDRSSGAKVLDVNLTGAFLGARAAARVMGDGGRLIFTGSVLGERPREGLAAYSASKAGLVGLAKGLALDLAPAGITVNVVARDGSTRRWPGWKNNPNCSAGILDHTAQRRWGAPPTSPAPTSSSPPTRRRSSPGRCSPSTADTCSHDAAPRAPTGRRDHRGRRSTGRRALAPLAGEPDTDLVLSDVSATSLEATVEWPARSPDGAVETLLADVSDFAQVEAVVDRAVERFGRLDVLISNAGVLVANGRIHNLAPRTGSAAFRVNVLGAVNGIRAAVPVMRAQRSGSIVLTASVAGLTAWSHAAPYCATKAAVIQLAKVAAVEYARDGIRVNCVCPGTFLSAIHAELPARGDRRDRRPAIPSGSAPPTTWSAPIPSWPVTPPDGRRARRMVVDGGYSAP